MTIAILIIAIAILMAIRVPVALSILAPQLGVHAGDWKQPRICHAHCSRWHRQLPATGRPTIYPAGHRGELLWCCGSPL